MLNFRKETEYSIQFLQYLAECSKECDCKSLQKFSEKSKISFYFMQKIARKLTKNNLITSTQGVNGGYILTAMGRKITLFKLIEIMESGVSLLPCVANSKICKKDVKNCQVRNMMCGLNKKIVDLMEKIKVIN